MLFLAAVVVFLVALVALGQMSYRRGVEPLRKLKPGKYHVRAVLYADNEEVMLAVSWHVDYGHYEYRLVRLKRGLLRLTPIVGDELIVSKNPAAAYDGNELVYVLHDI